MVSSTRTETAAVAARRFQARALAAMFGAGSLLGILAVIVPHGSGVNSAAWAINSALGLPVCVALWLVAGRTPTWTVHALLGTGAAMVSLGMVFGGSGPASIAASFFFVWVALYVSWFFSTRVALAHMIGDAMLFGATLLIEATSGGPAVWLLVMGTAVVVSSVVTLMRRELIRVANCDQLTGLPTRQVLEEAFSRETARALRDESPLGVVMLDVDGLKLVNDRDGHSAGDRMLADAAHAWRSVLRDGDLLVRFGGDEFVALLPNCTPEVRDALLERVVSAGSVRCSSGMTWWRPGDDLAETLARADEDLYLAKRALYSAQPADRPVSTVAEH